MKGDPVAIGSAIEGSTVVDAASYVWSSWVIVPGINQKSWTFRLQCILATATYLNAVFSANSLGTTPFATGATNRAAAYTINAMEGYVHEMRGSVYLNYQPAATTTIKQFWVTASGDDSTIV